MTSEQRFELSSQALGALPIVDHFLERLGLRATLERCLPDEDARVLMPAAQAIGVLVANLCLEREPLYGIAQWARSFPPGLLGLEPRRWSCSTTIGSGGRWISCLTVTARRC
jgi:Domain of unknown function (DUF4277)